ncbi:MAG: hypothetical protein AAF415_11350 [Pseudomonadota bacterium]
MTIKCLLFDVGGSVFDWQTAIVNTLAISSVGQSGRIDRQAFATAWREQSLKELEEIANETSKWRPFADFIATSLETTCLNFGLKSVDQTDRDALLSAWSAMPAWPEVRSSLERLRRLYFVAPHTIIGTGPVARSSKAAGLTWDAIVSCDALGASKVNKSAYVRCAELLEYDLAEICYVAAHASDLRAAASLGMKTAYVETRLEEYGEKPLGTCYVGEFDFNASDYAALADQMEVLEG